MSTKAKHRSKMSQHKAAMKSNAAASAAFASPSSTSGKKGTKKGKKRGREKDVMSHQERNRLKKQKAIGGNAVPLTRASSYESTFLTEEENLSCYYPIPMSPRAPPGQPFLARLHDELLSYSVSHLPSPAMTAARWSIIHGVREVAQDLWGPEVEVLPFGSFVTGLYIGSSDIDLVVLHVQHSKQQIASLLSKLGTRLRALGAARDVNLIPSARVPLLTYIDVASGVPVDISMGIIDGVQSAVLMKREVDAYPAFKPLTLFLKAFMQAMGLADVFKGGISSYILQIMILFHLQVQDTLHPQVATSTDYPQPLIFSSESNGKPLPPTANLGYLLFTFFELFGYTFSYEEHGIRIHDLKKSGASKLECYQKLPLGRFQRERPYLLSIEDPISKDRDIGGGCFGIRRIQRCFAVAREFLCTEPLAPKNAQPAPSMKSVKEHQEPSTLTTPFIIDTVGDRATATSATNGATASTTTATTASPSAATPVVDPEATSFKSSFGFILSSLLTLPVRYSIADLKRAALQQPAWNVVVAKLERLEKLEKKKANKAARKKGLELKLSKKEKKAAKAARKAAKKNNNAQMFDSIDLTDGMDESTEAAPTAAAGSPDSDSDSDIEVLDMGSSAQPIPIDDFDSDQDQPQPTDDNEGDDQGDEDGEEVDEDEGDSGDEDKTDGEDANESMDQTATTMDTTTTTASAATTPGEMKESTTTPTQSIPRPTAASTSPKLASTGSIPTAPTPAEAADNESATTVLDGDAMAAANEPLDANMELNWTK